MKITSPQVTLARVLESMDENNLSVRDAKVLLILKQHHKKMYADPCGSLIPHMEMNAISKHCGHSTAATTQMVDKLEKLKILERLPDPTDRRKILIALKAKGHTAIESILTTIKQ